MATAKAYNQAARIMVAGGLNWTADTIKCALVGTGYTPDQDNHDYYDDITAEFASGSGYTSGGVTLGTKVVNYAAASNTIDLSAANPTWASATLTGIKYAIFYKWTGTASTSPLIAYVDFGTALNAASQNVVVTIPTTGILRMTVA